jgi:hypothetical protein
MRHRAPDQPIAMPRWAEGVFAVDCETDEW